MRQLVEQLKTELERFIEQRDALWLLVESSDSDAPLVLKLLTDLEQANQTDIFLLFAVEFHTPAQYVAAVVAQLFEQHEQVNQALAEQGHPLLPQLPTSLLDDGMAPADRLREAMCVARELVPDEGGHRLVWVLWPTQVVDAFNYVSLLGQLVAPGSLPAWTRGLRLVLRELPGQPHAWARRFSPLRSRRARSDFSPHAIAQSLADTLEDESLPEMERMQALMMQAAMDQTQGRPQQAIAKYEALLAYYEKTENPTMLAVVMNHLGEVYHRQQQLKEARRWYECALVPAEQSPVPILTLLLARNLGDVAFLEGRFADAAFCYEQWHLISSRLEDTQGMVLALQKLGLAQERRGQHGAAIASYESASELCQTAGVLGLDKEHLEPLKRLYEQRGQLAKARAVADKLNQVTEVAS